MPDVECSVCGKIHFKSAYKAKKNKNFVCSPECEYKLRFMRFKGNEIRIYGDVAHIIIKSRKYGEVSCVIDSRNIDLVRGYTWRVGDHSGKIYVKTHKIGYIHRLITGAPDGMVVNHIDGDPLNNLMNNIRICTTAENLQNLLKNRDNKPHNAGRNVSFVKKTGMWRVRVHLNGKDYHGGFFEKLEDAEEAAIKKRMEIYTHATR